MANQNITLSIPKDILRKAKVIAIQRQTSLSGLLTEYLEEIVRNEDKYTQSQQRHLRMLEQGLDLGTEGQINIRRDDLHER